MSEPLKRTVEVRCSVAHAFNVFTARIDLWWPVSHRRTPRSRMRLETEPGGGFLEHTESGEEVELGRVIRWEPPHRLVYSWNPGSSTGPTEVEVRFEDCGDYTRVDVTHAEGRSGPGEMWPDRVKRFERAWQQVLPAFAAFAGGQHADAPGQ